MTAAIALLDPHVPVLSLGVLYVFAVLPIAVFWGLAYAIPVSIASMLAFNFFFLPPIHTFTLADSRNWFALAVFLVTAVVVSELEARSRRQARESALLAGVAASLLERERIGGELDRIAEGAARALQVERPSIELGDADRPMGGGGDERYPLAAAGRRVGTLYLERPRQGSAAARRRLLPALASLLGVAIDRERLAREALEAEALRRSDAMKTAVLRAVSHDLRTPLMAILTSFCEENKIPYQGVPVQTIKKFMTGKGNAGKPEMIAAARKFGFSPVDDNEADAIGILLWALEQPEAKALR